MVRIAISQAAFDAIVATMPLGSVGFENATNENGERMIWLKPGVETASGLCAGRAIASDVILALASEISR